MTNSRDKGYRGEKELLGILEDQLGLKLIRNAMQSARGGRDIAEDTDRKQAPIPFAIECKRQEKESLPAWWKQTVEQARDVDRIPVLFFRANRQPWRVALCPNEVDPETWTRDAMPPAGHYPPIVMPLELGLTWMREKL